MKRHIYVEHSSLRHLLLGKINETPVKKSLFCFAQKVTFLQQAAFFAGKGKGEVDIKTGS